MFKNFEDKTIKPSKKVESEKEKKNNQVETKKKRETEFFFPTLGETVRATSEAEALAKIKNKNL